MTLLADGNNELWRISPAGEVEVVPRDYEEKRLNGIIGTPDGRYLYVADIGARKTFRYAIGPDGTLTGKKLFCEMGSDGMTIDSEGNLYLTGMGVTMFSPQGKDPARSRTVLLDLQRLLLRQRRANPRHHRLRQALRPAHAGERRGKPVTEPGRDAEAVTTVLIIENHF